MELIYTDKDGKERGELLEYYLDADIGGNNDFELTVKSDTSLTSGCRILTYGSECGGILRRIKTDTASTDIVFGGLTWRGIISKKIIRPKTDQEYRIVNGNVATIVNGLLSEYGLSSLFTCDTTTYTVTDYQFEKYCTLLDGLNSMLKDLSKRVDIIYDGTDGKVHLSIINIVDHSENVEFSQDGGIQVVLQKNNDIINHLICIGKESLSVLPSAVDLYMDTSGNVSQTQTQFGLEEIVGTYEHSGGLTELVPAGTQKLLDQVRETAKIDIKDMDVALYDIVGARDYETGIYIKREVTQKIVRVTNGAESIEYKVGE